jgi:hypothetical protein
LSDKTKIKQLYKQACIAIVETVPKFLTGLKKFLTGLNMSRRDLFSRRRLLTFSEEVAISASIKRRTKKPEN